MRKKRTQVANPDFVNTFHITVRCVRKNHLLDDGKPIKGRALKRRRVVFDRIEALAQAYAIDIIRISIMDSHLHLELRNRPDLVMLMSDKEVARRYLMIYPGYCQATADAKGTDPDQPTEEDVEELAKDKKKIAEYRRVLSSISRFMQSLNFYTSRFFNIVDRMAGAFWESRYKLKLLLDDLSILLCAIYIDLNPIRANMHMKIEDSEYTSAYYQIRASAILRLYPNIDPSRLPNAFLTPVSISPNEEDRMRSSVSNRASDFGFTDLTNEEYLMVLDLLGRIITKKGTGAISADLPPIFERLNLNWDSVERLVTAYEELFGFFVGTSDSLEAKARELKCGKLQCPAVRQGLLPSARSK